MVVSYGSCNPSWCHTVIAICRSVSICRCYYSRYIFSVAINRSVLFSLIFVVISYCRCYLSRGPTVVAICCDVSYYCWYTSWCPIVVVICCCITYYRYFCRDILYVVMSNCRCKISSRLIVVAICRIILLSLLSVVVSCCHRHQSCPIIVAVSTGVLLCVVYLSTDFMTNELLFKMSAINQNSN